MLSKCFATNATFPNFKGAEHILGILSKERNFQSLTNDAETGIAFPAFWMSYPWFSDFHRFAASATSCFERELWKLGRWDLVNQSRKLSWYWCISLLSSWKFYPNVRKASLVGKTSSDHDTRSTPLPSTRTEQKTTCFELKWVTGRYTRRRLNPHVQKKKISFSKFRL